MIPLLVAALCPVPAPAGGDIAAVQLQKLQASDLSPGDDFGISVALDGDTAVVGAWLADSPQAAAGAAYVYVAVGTHWVEQAKLVASDAEANDHFGYAVAVDGDQAVVGAYNRNEGVDGAGVAYVFERTGVSLDLVRVTNKDTHIVYLTAFTNEVPRPTGMGLDTGIVLGESPSGTPRPIKAWFPDHARTGREFIYR